MFTISSISHKYEKGNITLGTIPDLCPLCQQHITPIIWEAPATTKDREAEVLFRCPNDKCAHFFLGHYLDDFRGQYYLVAVAPIAPAEHPFDDVIRKLSPRFCDVYDQAEFCKRQLLVEVAGPGFRKALEILVKDYAKHRQPGAEPEIEKLQLKPCLDRFFDSERVRKTAERAAWLGNDETHYVRKWPEADLDDLIALIGLTVSFVTSELQYENIMNKMPEGR